MATATKKSREWRRRAPRYGARDGTGPTRLRLQARRVSDDTVDLVSCRSVPIALDDSDALRWLDDGGSVLSKEATQWSARR